jgi:hypothetical protein
MKMTAIWAPALKSIEVVSVFPQRRKIRVGGGVNRKIPQPPFPNLFSFDEHQGKTKRGINTNIMKSAFAPNVKFQSNFH